MDKCPKCRILSAAAVLKALSRRMTADLFGYSTLKRRSFGRNAPQGKKGIAINVIYQQGLEEIAGMLSAMGYAMHPMSSGVAADAVLYTSDVRGALRTNTGAAGTALLCVRGMNAAQISQALKRRSCCQLF